MKRIFLIMSISVILLALMGCGEKPASKALKSSDKFLEKLFTYNDTDKIIDEQSNKILMDQFIEGLKPYMTEKGYNNHVANRDLIFTYYAAYLNRCNISADNIKTSLRKEFKEDKYYITINEQIS